MASEKTDIKITNTCQYLKKEENLWVALFAHYFKKNIVYVTFNNPNVNENLTNLVSLRVADE